jgi:ABC-type phosphate/phosphonate transport system substrate-binding protein
VGRGGARRRHHPGIVTRFICNARMYAVAPAAEAAWEALFAAVSRDADVPLDYEAYPAPAPLEALWRRPDLGCVFMCGFPIALGIAEVQVLAAPIPAASWAGGRAVYRSDFIVRADSPFRTLEDTFGHRIGWTVAHSQSGFNAPRHHLLRHGRALYRESVGDLVTARRVLDAVLEGRIEVGPLDAYWHALIARHRPDLAAGIRVLESTAPTPIPSLVAAPGFTDDDFARLRAALLGAASRPWFAPLAEPLRLAGFAALERRDYGVMLEWDWAARDAAYDAPG